MKKNKDPNYPYRKGKSKTPSSKRLAEVQHKSLKEFSVFRSYIMLLFMPPSIKSAFTYLDVVIRKFFMSQYLQKIHFAHKTVRHVDHELDEKVPFDTSHLDIYLDFVNFWLRPVSMLGKRFGLMQGSRLGGEYLCYIKKAYNEAYRIYGHTMTTTYRPYSEDKRIIKMRKADPHFLCVPSLHIAIIFLTCGFFDMLFKRESFTEEESRRWQKELFEEATAIGESVLYVKQHSVNCIPAAIYMMTSICPELFGKDYALHFIDSLFQNAKDISAEDCEAIRSHIRTTYLDFSEKKKDESDWTIPVIRWIESYHSYEPFYAIQKKRRLYGKMVRFVRHKQFNYRRKYS